MRSEFHSISMLRKNFDSLRPSKKVFECEVTKAASTTNLCETKKKKYENLPTEKLVKLIKNLKNENKELKKENEKCLKRIKELSEEVSKLKKGETSSRPVSCLRTSNSVPKKNRVMFSRDLVQVLNENVKKGRRCVKMKVKEDPAFSYNYNFKKVTRKSKNESNSPEKAIEESEYYTPLSSSLQDRKMLSQTVIKHFDISPKFRDKQKLYTKIAKF